ncbi:MAG: ABC transporter permease [Bryobacteraceae bacterium]|nr:ABC transporter permease [Bryobacteraceae bacterium]
MWERLMGVFRRRELESRMDEEFADHFERLVEANVAKGMTRREAETEARRRFGSVEAAKDAYRDQGGVPWLEQMWQDAKYAARTLVKKPGFAAVAVLTLALGIGANTSIFSVINAVLLRPLPYPEPERIVQFDQQYRGREGSSAFTGSGFFFLRDHLRSYEAVASSGNFSGISLSTGGEAVHIEAARATDGYFATLGLRPMLGREFLREETEPGGADVVILGHGLWVRLFGADSGVLGRRATLGGKAHVVVGVLPEGDIQGIDAWMPLRPNPGDGGQNRMVRARLKAGISYEQAQAELDSLLPEFFKATFSKPPEGLRYVVRPFLHRRGQDRKPTLYLLLAAVAAVLLIACANLANLLLARASGRTKEVAIRATLGAGRGRLVRQLLVESLLLSLAGGAVGAGLSQLLLPALVKLDSVQTAAIGTISVDGVVLAFTLALSVVTGIVFGLAPALAMTRLDLNEAVKEGGGRTTAGRSSGRLRQGLVVAEMALSVMLLIAAGLLIRSFTNLAGLPSGVDPRNVLTGQMSLGGERYGTTAAVASLYRRGLQQLRQLPGVEAAAAIINLPLERGMNAPFRRLEAPNERAGADWRYVTPDYFATVRLPLRAGRVFSESDSATGPAVVIVNEAFARKYYRNENPIGKQLCIMCGYGDVADRTRTIVGVVGDNKQMRLNLPAPETMFVPVEQVPDTLMRMAHGWFTASWVVRYREGAGSGLAAAVEREMRAVDAETPFSGFQSLEAVIGRSLSRERFQMLLLGVFALVALALSTAGIYGVISYTVAQRSHEIAVRMALGATVRGVVASIVGRGALLGAAGVVLGIGGSLALRRLLDGMLYGVAATDPLTIAAVAGALLAVSMVATAAPAFSASRLDPAVTLRSQ